MQREGGRSGGKAVMDTAENTGPSACTRGSQQEATAFVPRNPEHSGTEAPRAVNVRLSLSTGRSAERLF